MVLSLDELKIIADEQGFSLPLIEKDYLITHLLFLLKKIEGIYFKGGTALNKIFLEHARLSEDIDFSITRSVSSVEKDIRKALRNTIFKEITHDKKVDKFIRLVVHYKLFHEKGTIFIDLNERAQLILAPEKKEIKHFYEDIPRFEINILNSEELIAEKMAAAIGRNKPRDHFDLYQIIKHKIPINTDLVKKKCLQSGHEFSIIKMFNNAKKLNKRWNEDLILLLKEEITFEEVMKTLAKHFKLKEEKKK